MNAQEIAAVIDKQDEDRYEWLESLLCRKALPFRQRRAIVNHIRNTREVFIVDQRRNSGDTVELCDADGDPIDESEDIFSLVAMPHPQISITWYNSVREAHDHALTLGLRPYVHVYDFPTIKQ